MVSPDNNNKPAAKSAGKDETHTSAARSKTAAARPQEPALKCPRCDSANTKFCYYNNYSLTQPRHFCKTCRRYWTRGGALRNVPIGGGCRKNKKTAKCSLSGGVDSKDSGGSSSHRDNIGGLKFFQGISPAMDFQLGGINNLLPSPNTALFNQFSSSFGEISNDCGAIPAVSSSPLMGFSFPFTPSLKQQGEGMSNIHGFHEMGNSLNVNSNLASSIESLSSINQDLHWKLQQQRLAAMMFVGDQNQRENSTNLTSNIENFVQKPQPILFQNLDISKPESACGIGTQRRDNGGGGNLSTEWFFDNSYATVTPTPASSGSNVNDNTSNNWSGIQAWSDLTQYTALP